MRTLGHKLNFNWKAGCIRDFVSFIAVVGKIRERSCWVIGLIWTQLASTLLSVGPCQGLVARSSKPWNPKTLRLNFPKSPKPKSPKALRFEGLGLGEALNPKAPQNLTPKPLLSKQVRLEGCHP